MTISHGVDHDSHVYCVCVLCKYVCLLCVYNARMYSVCVCVCARAHYSVCVCVHARVCTIRACIVCVGACMCVRDDYKFWK